MVNRLPELTSRASAVEDEGKEKPEVETCGDTSINVLGEREKINEKHQECLQG